MSEHPGRELKKLREAKGISLAQAARDTRLREGLLRELEECSDIDELPEVYRKLSLRMYARYLGLEFELTRRAPRSVEGRMRITPVGFFLRRSGRPAKPARLDPAQRNRLLAVAKTASAAIVTVLAVGLWSLNAKISRLHFDDTPLPVAEVKREPVQDERVAVTMAVQDATRLALEENVSLTLVPRTVCEGKGL